MNAEDYGTVLVVEPSSHFIFTWHPDGPDYATTVEFTLTPDERGTVVRLTESGYHDTENGRQSILNCATGWGEPLTLLKFYIEHGMTY